MITLKEALSKLCWRDIESRLIKLYPDQKVNLEGYREVIEELLTITPTDNPGGSYICADYVPPDPKLGGDFYDVYVYDPVRKQDYAPMYSWENWLGLLVDGQKNVPMLDIVCHALYEMTYHGFSRSKVEEKQNRIASAFEKAFRSMVLEGEEE